MFDHLRTQFFGAIREAIGKVFRGGLIGTLLGVIAIEIVGFLVDGGWPERVFVHVAAVAFGLALGYAIGATLALVEGVRGLVKAADDLAKVAATGGYNVLDKVVDSVDGPERHGLRG
jgi:hypothetical protein